MFYLINDSGLTVSFPGEKTFNVAKDHVHFSEVLKEVQSGKATVASLDKLVDLKAEISKLSSNGVEITLDENEMLKVSIDGNRVDVLSEELQYRLIQMLNEADSDLRTATYNSFALFIKNLYQNPSYKSVQQLYGFLEANDLPITQNGTFLAYKKVRYDYLDIHSASFDNSIGKTVSMLRNMVEDDPEKTCSAGLHVCSYSYLDNYAESALDRVVICEVNPKDVVSIPVDYNNAKMRVCEYKVVDEIPTYFDAQLGSYIYGKHEDGWISKTFEKLVDLFKAFFKVTTVSFNEVPRTVLVTPAVVNSFWSKAEEMLQGIDIPEQLVTSSKENLVLPTIKTMIQWLSKYDSNWTYLDESEIESEKYEDSEDDYDEDEYSDEDYDEDDDIEY